MIKLAIYRFNPEQDAKPYMQDFAVPEGSMSGVMLLDALNAIKNTIDGSFTYRHSCAQGVCGSDAMNINGKNGLACTTPLAQFKGSKIIIRPLPGMSVIKDLVVDLSNFYKQYKKVKPFLQNSGAVPAGEYIQFPEQRNQLDGLYECILCACCTSSCPSYWWNPEKFIGPAAALQAARFILDSRDDATQSRLTELEDAYSIYRCRSIMNCVDVCPKGLNPTKAISHIRHSMLKSGT